MEVLIVLGIIAAISAAILPNLGLTPGSQMSLGLRDITNNIRATYDSAVLTGRVHRLVIHPTTSEYWAEQAPLGFEGRPPLAEDTSGTGATAAFNADARVRLLEELDKAASEPRKAQKGDRTYSARSMLVVQRRILKPIKWTEVDDAVLFKRTLPGSVGFNSVVTDGMRKKLELQETTEKDFAYVYFFPDGTVQQAAMQIGLKKGEKEIDDMGPKFSVYIDPLSGRSELLEGFQDPEFLKDQK